MKFQIYISKLANKFFFISNLTEWHFSCRSGYNKKWLEIFEPLDKEEKEYLLAFKRILQNHGFTDYLGRIFISQLNEKQVWQKLKNILTKKEFEIIKKIFILFDKKFNKIWLAGEKIQKQNKKIIIKELESQRTKNILVELEVFFNQKPSGAVNIYLMANPLENYFAGGANLDGKSITIETGQIIPNTSSSEKTIRAISHEYLHLFLDKHWIQKIILAELKKQKIKSKDFLNKRALVEEALICSLFPNGYLAEKYFHFKVKDKAIGIKKQVTSTETQKMNLSLLIAIQMYEISKRYFEKKKKINRNYIKKIIEIMKKDE